MCEPMTNELQNAGGSDGAVLPPTPPFVYDVGTSAVEHRKYGPVVIEGNGPSGVRVRYRKVPVELKNEVDGEEDIVSIEDLQSASPYSDEQIADAIRTHFRT